MKKHTNVIAAVFFFLLGTLVAGRSLSFIHSNPKIDTVEKLDVVASSAKATSGIALSPIAGPESSLLLIEAYFGYKSPTDRGVLVGKVMEFPLLGSVVLLPTVDGDVVPVPLVNLGDKIGSTTNREVLFPSANLLMVILDIGSARARTMAFVPWAARNLVFDNSFCKREGTFGQGVIGVSNPRFSRMDGSDGSWTLYSAAGVDDSKHAAMYAYDFPPGTIVEEGTPAEQLPPLQCYPYKGLLHPLRARGIILPAGMSFMQTSPGALYDPAQISGNLTVIYRKTP